MAATIKLMRFGKKSQPSYRIVVMDKRKKRDGSYIEKLGFYNPITEPATIKIDKVRFESWVKKGAELSEGIQKIMHIFIKK